MRISLARALLGRVDVVNVIVDGALEAARHLGEHKQILTGGEVDHASQDGRRDVVDGRRRRELHVGGSKADLRVEVVDGEDGGHRDLTPLERQERGCCRGQRRGRGQGHA